METEVEIVTYRMMCWKTKNMCLSQRYFHMLRCSNNSRSHCNSLVFRNFHFIFLEKYWEIGFALFQITIDTLLSFYDRSLSLTHENRQNNAKIREIERRFIPLYTKSTINWLECTKHSNILLNCINIRNQHARYLTCYSVNTELGTMNLLFLLQSWTVIEWHVGQEHNPSKSSSSLITLILFNCI